MNKSPADRLEDNLEKKYKQSVQLPEFKNAKIIDGIKTITQSDIDNTLHEATYLKRARKSILIHESFSEVPQRFVNCLNSNSYVRPHMHLVPNQWELMCWISGEIIALIFDDDGKVISKILMNENNVRMIEIPPFRYHTFVAVKKGSYLEIRNCKYQPNIDRLYSAWSPPEESHLAIDYQKKFFLAEIGDSIII